jgi:hypothetical protein
MTEPIGGREILVRLVVILVGILLLIAPFYILPTLGIYSASYGGFVVFITGFLVVFFSLALWIGRRKFAGDIPTSKRERLRFVLILVGIILLVSPISTGRGLGVSGAFADVLAVIIGIGILVLATPAQFRAAKRYVFLEGHPRAGFTLKGRKPYLFFILLVSVIGFFMIAFFIPVRSEPTGWYYYTDDSGCTHEYRLGTGPDPNPPQQSITGMYYNLWGSPMEHAYPSDYDYQVCS